MKKFCYVLVILALIFAVMACSSSAPKSEGPTQTPPWLNDFPPDDVFWGIGTAKQSSPTMSMTTAEARARTNIARQLQTRVQAMFVDYNIDAGTVSAQANASMQEDVSRQITNIDLSGARPIQRWEAPDGTWWYLVSYRKTDARNAVASILGNEEAAYAQFKAQQALLYLDSQLGKSERPVPLSE